MTDQIYAKFAGDIRGFVRCAADNAEGQYFRNILCKIILQRNSGVMSLPVINLS